MTERQLVKIPAKSVFLSKGNEVMPTAPAENLAHLSISDTYASFKIPLSVLLKEMQKVLLTVKCKFATL